MGVGVGVVVVVGVDDVIGFGGELGNVISIYQRNMWKGREKEGSGKKEGKRKVSPNYSSHSPFLKQKQIEERGK